MKPNILIVDDDLGTRSTINMLLEDEYKVLQAENSKKAFRILQESSVDLILLDILLGDSCGTTLLSQMRALKPMTPIIMVTVVNDSATRRECEQKGACGYLAKPFTDKELIPAITSALQKNVRQHPWNKDNYFDQYGMIGESEVMKELYQRLEEIKAGNRILITGETGVGKGLAARALHRIGPRSTRPFIPVNCPAIPETLLENQLFGHERGAFTGASERTRGLLETANGGTILLDEISEMSLSAQAKLLSVLDTGEFSRVGGNEILKSDAFVYATSNRDLPEATKRGSFREDLYYRLKVFEVRVPPLRQRREDVPLLVEHFAGKYVGERGIAAGSVANDIMKRLPNEYPWNGNVRDLDHIVQNVLASGEKALRELEKAADHIPGGNLKEEMRPFIKEKIGSIKLTRKAFQLFSKKAHEDLDSALCREFIDRLRSKYPDATIASIAKGIGIGYLYLYRMMQKAGIDPEKHRE